MQCYKRQVTQREREVKGKGSSQRGRLPYKKGGRCLINRGEGGGGLFNFSLTEVKYDPFCNTGIFLCQTLKRIPSLLKKCII